MCEDVLEELEAAGKVEAVGDALVQRSTDVDHVADFLVAVLHHQLLLVEGADGDHDAVGAVVVQMVVDRGTLDAAQVGGQDGGVVRVGLPDVMGQLAPEVQDADDLHHQHQDRAGELGQIVHDLVHAAGGVLAFAGLLHVAHDVAAQGVDGGVVLGHDHQQGLLGGVGKTALADEAQADLMPLVHAPALDEAVEVGPLFDDTGDAQQRAVKDRGLVLRMLGVALFQELEELGGIDGVAAADLAVGAVGQDVGHQGLHARGLDPAPVGPVAPFFFLKGAQLHWEPSLSLFSP